MAKRVAKKPTVKKKTAKRKSRAIDAAWLNTHDWMLRSSNNGVSYNGFEWPAIGKWISVPFWNCVGLFIIAEILTSVVCQTIVTVTNNNGK